jgi:hypothetical protein
MTSNLLRLAALLVVFSLCWGACGRDVVLVTGMPCVVDADCAAACQDCDITAGMCFDVPGCGVPMRVGGTGGALAQERARGSGGAGGGGAGTGGMGGKKGTGGA